MLARTSFGLLLACSLAAPVQAKTYLVHDQGEFAQAARKVAAGDTIVLADGKWRDFDLVITGHGQPGKPITVTAQHPGNVTLAGQSSLQMSGDYLVISGLVFRDGYSPRGEVISFRTSRSEVANNSRVTQVVIDGFSKPGRYDNDYWVSMYGRHNRFDHNDLIGKTNMGVTLAVRLDTPASRNNGDLIDHNYFGPRQVLGANGGESIRVGTSKYSMYTSGTTVEENIFDRCDGEVEIVSSKSDGNIYRGNLFLRSRGTLTLRHGNGNMVERNVFLGHGKDYTGGIRVIARNQTVRDNYMEGLRGKGFASALTVMNGVPNSPVNRYVQVDNALVEHNTVVDSATVTLGAGASAERTAPPINSHIADNLFVGLPGKPLFQIDADISGIAFKGNIVAANTGGTLPPDMKARSLNMQRAANGLLYPTNPSLAQVGAPRDLVVPRLDQVGAPWYPKPTNHKQFGTSEKLIRVAPGEDTLFAAVARAKSGDTLVLESGIYTINEAIPLTKSLTIRGAFDASGDAPTVLLMRPTFIELEDGGNLQLQGLVIDGSPAPDAVGSSVIRTGPDPIKSNMVIELSDVTVRNLDVNSSFNVLTLGKSTLAQHVVIRDSHFRDISGTIVSATAESDNFGRYNVEFLDMTGNSFTNVGGPIAAIYRGGTDESTFGPSVTIRDNTLTNVGHRISGGHTGAIDLHGAQITRIDRNTFISSGRVKIVHTVGNPDTELSKNRFIHSPAPIYKELEFNGPPRVKSENNTIDGRPL